MNETIETNYDDFFGAFEGADGNQTDTAEDTTETVATDDQTVEEDTTASLEDLADEAEEGVVDEESEDGEMTPDSQKEATVANAEVDKAIPEQKFVVKVNKETREVSYQDAPAWIQKGMDYDRVKGQLETEQQEKATLQAEVDKYKPQMEILQLAAEAAGTTVEAMLEGVQIGMFKSKGMTESEARAELRNIRLEKQIKDLALQKQQPTQEPEKEAKPDEGSERAQRELAEFKNEFPDVQLTKELVDKLVPDVQKGMSLTSAYLKLENQRLKDEAKQRQQQDAAKKQNTKNRAKTPGSMNDSGGQRTKDAFDDCFGAFEK